MGQANHAQDVGLSVGLQIAHEGPVDLDLAHREEPKPEQRRVAGAEVVDRDRHAQPGDGVEHRAGLFGLLEHRGLGDLQGQHGRHDAVAIQHFAHPAGKRGVPQVGRREVDRDLDRPPARVPAPRLLEGQLDDMVGERTDRLTGLDVGQELVRRPQLAVARQRSSASAAKGWPVSIST